MKGMAMGKKFAPSYANIFMAEWKDTALAMAVKKASDLIQILDDI